MCSTLIPYFAEPDDIRLNTTDHEPALSMSSSYHHQTSLSSSLSSSSSSSFLPSSNHYTDASLKSPESLPHIVNRRSSSSSSSSNEDESIEDVDSNLLYSEEQILVRSRSTSASKATSDRSDETVSVRKRSGGKHSSLDSSKNDRIRREGDERPSTTLGNISHTNHRHDPTRSRPGNQSLAATRPTHGHRTPSPSQLTINYPEDPVVARLLRRWVIECGITLRFNLFNMKHSNVGPDENPIRQCVGKFGPA